MITIDTSAIMLGLLSDGEARRIMSTELLAVPNFADAELTQVMIAQVERGAVPPRMAQQSLRRWSRLGATRYSVVGMIDQVWSLRGDFNVHEACYVVMAEALDGPLVTADERYLDHPAVSVPITIVRD